MVEAIVYTMIYGGSAIMLFNIFGFFHFAYRVAKQNKSKKSNVVFFIPAILVTLFFLGYLGVAIWGKPDLLVAAILFGGAVYVLIMLILLRSIDKRMTENEELKVKLLASEESQKAKSSFLADVSHEMRTPLNVIIGLNKMALDDESLQEDTRQRLLRIDSNAKKLLGLVNNVIDMNAIESDELSIKEDEFSLEGAVGHIDVIAASMAKEKGIDYEMIIAEEAKGTYIGDENKIKQILGSLLDNAIKYTDEGGRIRLNIDRAEEKTRFVVEDNGQGMEPEFLEKAFEVFTKEDEGIRTSHAGSGLGLAVTKGIVEKLGGEIKAVSKKNVGSTFTVILPLHKLDKTEETEVSLEGKRILVVEDIPDNAEIVMDLLELEGVECEHAENGEVAVNMFSQSDINYYDAILMDLRMPIKDGLTATREIRALKREDAQTVPIVALTANAFETDVRESLSAGMNAHLSKPADSDKLYATLKMVLRKR